MDDCRWKFGEFVGFGGMAIVRAVRRWLLCVGMAGVVRGRIGFMREGGVKDRS